jgi:glycosyltransferase involved in cell wall biosynthesis
MSQTAASVHESPGDGIEVSVLVPMHDEQDNVAPLHELLSAALAPMQLRYQLLFIDDGSSDGTAVALDRLEGQDPNLLVVRHAERRGKAAALESALVHARGTWLLIMDGDLQYDPHDIPLLLEALRSGADVVSGCRDERSDPWVRRSASRVYNTLVNILAGTRFRDHFSGIKGFRAEALDSMPMGAGMRRFPLVVAAHSGLEVREVPVTHRDRGSGSSSYNLLALVALALRDLASLVPFLVRSKRPARRPSS